MNENKACFSGNLKTKKYIYLKMNTTIFNKTATPNSVKVGN